jgi:superfamily II DNA or RNA helicase
VKTLLFFSLSKKLFFYFHPHTFVVVHFSESLAQLQAAKKRLCTAQHWRSSFSVIFIFLVFSTRECL